MGNFSWITKEGHPIVNRRFGNKLRASRKFTVYMHAPKCSSYPNGKTWIENNYGGYGIFGGKDYYVLLAEINGYALLDIVKECTNYNRQLRIKMKHYKSDFSISNIAFEKLRAIGCDLFFNRLTHTAMQYPILSEEEEWKGDYTSPNITDQNQGDYNDSDGESETDVEAAIADAADAAEEDANANNFIPPLPIDSVEYLTDQEKKIYNKKKITHLQKNIMKLEAKLNIVDKEFHNKLIKKKNELNKNIEKAKEEILSLT